MDRSIDILRGGQAVIPPSWAALFDVSVHKMSSAFAFLVSSMAPPEKEYFTLLCSVCVCSSVYVCVQYTLL